MTAALLGAANHWSVYSASRALRAASNASFWRPSETVNFKFATSASDYECTYWRGNIDRLHSNLRRR